MEADDEEAVAAVHGTIGITSSRPTSDRCEEESELRRGGIAPIDGRTPSPEQEDAGPDSVSTEPCRRTRCPPSAGEGLESSEPRLHTGRPWRPPSASSGSAEEEGLAGRPTSLREGSPPAGSGAGTALRPAAAAAAWMAAALGRGKVGGGRCGGTETAIGEDGRAWAGEGMALGDFDDGPEDGA